MKRAPDFSALPEWGTNKRRLTKLDRGSLAFDTQNEPTIDLNAMAATTVISTPTPDRIKDSMNPAGCLLDNYRKNPIVLYEHGFGGIATPVGKSSDPDERLTIAISEAAVLGTCYFSQKTLEAAQIFDLVVERIIRASSIRFSPVKSSVERDDNEEIYRFDEWDLEEWSWVTIPCNPEAVTGVIAKGRLAGKPIVEPIMKSLQLWLPERAAQARGWTPPQESDNEGRTVAKNNGKPSGKPKTKADEKPEDEPVDDAPAADTPADEPVEEVTANDSPADQPYGMQVLAATFNTLSEMVSQCESALGPLENPAVKEALGTFIASQQEALAMLEGAYGTAYPDAEPLKSETPDESQAEEAMKSFLSSGRGPQLQLLGHTIRLKGLAKAKNLNTEQKRVLGQTINQLGAMLAKAKAHKPTADDAKEQENAALRQQVTELANTVGALSKTFKDAIPHRKAV